MPERSAHDIASEMLVLTGNAMRDGDFDAFMRHFGVPFIMETFDGKHLFQSRTEMEKMFHAVRQFYEENNVSSVIRECVAAEYVDHRTIATTHVTRMVTSDDTLFGRPYPAYSLTRRIGGTWQIQFCQYAVEDPEKLNAVLQPDAKKKAPRQTATPSSSKTKRLRSPSLRTSS